MKPSDKRRGGPLSTDRPNVASSPSPQHRKGTPRDRQEPCDGPDALRGGLARGRYQLLPELTTEEFTALRDDIAERGVMVPVEVDDEGRVLDGHHRARACEEMGINYPVVVRSGLTETEKRQHARRANLLRRHLSRQQRRQVIADVIADEPELSNRAVARLVGCSHNTVQQVRDDGRGGGQVDHQDVVEHDGEQTVSAALPPGWFPGLTKLDACIAGGVSMDSAILVVCGLTDLLKHCRECCDDEDFLGPVRDYIIAPRIAFALASVVTG